MTESLIIITVKREESILRRKGIGPSATTSPQPLHTVIAKVCRLFCKEEHLLENTRETSHVGFNWKFS